MASKTVCQVSRSEFRTTARSLMARLTEWGSSDGVAEQVLGVKEFSTGSFGWYGNGKVQVTVGGKVVECQVGFTLTVIGSKDLPKDPETAAA
jgi:hypothetical protein